MDAHYSNRGGKRISGGTGASVAEINIWIKKQLTCTEESFFDYSLIVEADFLQINDLFDSNPFEGSFYKKLIDRCFWAPDAPLSDIHQPPLV